MNETLAVNEIFLSIQGESSFAGLPCIFVRLTGCNLRCSYCDTAYAFSEGKTMTFEEIENKISSFAAPYLEAAGVGSGDSGSAACPGRLPLVELTGGEPLLQKNSVFLMRRLCDAGFTVLLETSGSLNAGSVDPRVRRIMDLKCPSSGEESRNCWENLALLNPWDEIKFVIATREDYAWSKEVLSRHNLTRRCALLFSWASPLTGEQRSGLLKKPPEGQTPISRRELAEMILGDALPVRFQAQLHKIIWPADARGV